MDFRTYTEELDARIRALTRHRGNITAAKETMRSAVHWTSDGRRVSATANANTEVIFETEIEDDSPVTRWPEPDDLTAPRVDQFATMIAGFLEGDDGEMATLTDADVVPNYTFASTGRIDRGEELFCSRCGRHSIEAGTESHVWYRIPNRNTHLPRSIELCEVCDHQVRQLQSNEPT